MRNIIFSLLVSIALAACSSDKPVTYTADKMFGGDENGAHVKLVLDNFNDEQKEGTGNIAVNKTPGSQWAGQEGAYPVTWKRFGNLGSILVTVNGTFDSFFLETNPADVSLPGLSKDQSYWCKTCEQARNGGFGVLPGLFVKND